MNDSFYIVLFKNMLNLLIAFKHFAIAIVINVSDDFFKNMLNLLIAFKYFAIAID